MKSDKRKQQYKQLGLAVAYYRKMHGLTQLQLAEECDLSRTHISNLEAPNMPTSISLEALFDIADVLEVPIKCFFDFPDASGNKYRLSIPGPAPGIFISISLTNWTIPFSNDMIERIGGECL
ncbi:MAG: helix-turn-helix domain-containing protein [Lachnospiraceae bacterium]